MPSLARSLPAAQLRNRSRAAADTDHEPSYIPTESQCMCC
jgi:hypothetical protein